jgi:hypothetical protein
MTIREIVELLGDLNRHLIAFQKGLEDGQNRLPTIEVED